mmetsp:Transcript_34463/g.60481  ORF Transcript_34463/g.60481 Transcript_34463/m.60481 type:complete len:194 (+) Transcript_34463:873-1454(+)
MCKYRVTAQHKCCEICNKVCSRPKDARHLAKEKTPTLLQMIKRQSDYVESLLNSHKLILKKLSEIANIIKQEVISETAVSLPTRNSISPCFELGLLYSLPVTVISGKSYMLSLEVKPLTGASAVLAEAVTFAIESGTESVELSGFKTRGISLITFKKLKVAGAGVEVSLTVVPLNATYIRPLQLPKVKVVMSD